MSTDHLRQNVEPSRRLIEADRRVWRPSVTQRMFSFYVASPAGFAVEVGHGARTIGEDWDDSRHHRVSAWGRWRPQPTAGPPP